MEILIRKFEPQDHKSLSNLIVLLQDHIALLDEFKKNRPGKELDIEKYMEQLYAKVNNSDGVIYLAVKGEELLGAIVGIISPQTEQDLIEEYPCREGKILELIVQPEHRGKKIGSQLMNSLEKFFIEKNCSFVRVGVFAPNTQAYKFYKEQNYKDRYIDLLKKL